MDWIKKIAPTVGLVIGIVFVAIGAIVSIQAIGKLSFTEPDLSYIEENCSMRLYGPVFDKGETVASSTEPTESEKESCIKSQTLREQAGFKNRHTDALITGISMLIVGGIFWLLFKERKNK